MGQNSWRVLSEGVLNAFPLLANHTSDTQFYVVLYGLVCKYLIPRDIAAVTNS